MIESSTTAVRALSSPPILISPFLPTGISPIPHIFLSHFSHLSYRPIQIYNGIFLEILLGQKHLVGPEISQCMRPTRQI